ncbi:TPA: Dot/Icm T4SS effector RavM [Legionella pneumophila]|nr:Dot/Icm T4SS effector RavM [Legionella pneumophila]HAU0901857.1 Dot/Icm T4SS effector RavM [Legionella pneumophila]HAU0929230.1 Dot/Icm T4SS effector RavM [Legionella pneumophila]HDO7910096.1 Dot/Icm T4SS effector RavM [Legionella pneumophila]HDO7944151.1 Dot/Icm T4SS effector RavM [Legionella pneumophila]
MKYFLKLSRQHSSNQKKRTQPAQFEDHHLRIRQPQYAPITIDLVGSVRFIFTFSLFCFRAIAGLLTGAISRKNLFDFVFNRTKTGLTGSIEIITVRRRLTKATQKIQEITPQKSLLERESEEPSISTNTKPTIKPNTTHEQNVFFTKSEEKSETKQFKAVESHDFNNSEELMAFMAKINELIAQDEAMASPKDENESSSTVGEEYIEKLIEIMKNSELLKHEFWSRLDQMTYKDIQLFVSKLSPTKEKGKFGSSDLDYLWRYFNGFEFEPSKRENRKDKFAVMLEALSEEQLKASFDSSDFLSLLNKDYYIETAANTLKRKQLALFASDSKRHDILNLMIKKLKPSAYLLGKLASVMPYATTKIKIALIDQIAHLPHSASFKIELAKLAEHHIGMNTQTYIKRYQSLPALPSNTTHSKPPLSKWASVPAVSKPIYTNIPVAKEDWTDEAFEAFLRELNATTYLINEKKIIDDLNSLPDHRIKMIIEKASSPDYKDMLKHFWMIESKTINHRSFIENRKNRLKIILENLSESQLKSSIKDNKFWDIFRNTQEPYCKMAAKVLSPRQFEIIISNATLERHADFAVIITQIKKDSSADKERLQQIIEAIIPHTTPWFALALERQIKGLLTSDKSLFEKFSTDLKKYLSKSLERPEVSLKYRRDRDLNRRAISHLLTEPLENSYKASFSL